MTEPLLHALDLSVDRPTPGGTRRVLDHASLTLHAGQCHGLVGRSGAGKTTLVRTLLALEAPVSGQVTWKGRPVTTGHVRDLRPFRRSVQYVPQDARGSIDPRRRIGASLLDPLRRLQRPGDHQAAITQALDAVDLPTSTLARRPAELSGGQAQRVALARALAIGADALVADEPISGLDLPLRDQVLDLLGRLSRERGLAVLLVTHDLDALTRLCPTTTVLDAGRVVEHGPTAQLLAHPAHPATAALVAATPRLRHPLPLPHPKGSL